MHWIVSIPPLISSSSSIFSRYFETVPRTPATIGNTLTFMSQSFFSSRVKYQNLSSFSFFLLLLLGSLLAEQNPLYD